MTTPSLRRLFFAPSLLLGLLALPESAAAQCTQTLSVGANLSSAVSSAANGSTICLNDGNYGGVNFFNITRTEFVTLRSVNGTGARLQPSVGNSRFIRFTNVTVGSAIVNSCSQSIEFIGTPFVANASGLLFDASACPSTTHNYVVDGATFDRVGQSLYEGRLNCRDCNGAVIRNSTFSGVGSSASDGIQTQGNTRNLTIGPNNRFTGILESLCGSTNCDAVQFQGGGTTVVTSNIFENGDTFIMSPDGCSNVTVEHNVFNGAGASYPDKVQFGSCSNLTFRHNTVTNVRVSMDSKTGEPATSNARAENNVMRGSTTNFKTENGNGCSGCSFSYNLFDDAADARGTNNVIGAPSLQVERRPPRGQAGCSTPARLETTRVTTGETWRPTTPPPNPHRRRRPRARPPGSASYLRKAIGPIRRRANHAAVRKRKPLSM
jgi:hypothetical protein